MTITSKILRQDRSLTVAAPIRAVTLICEAQYVTLYPHESLAIEGRYKAADAAGQAVYLRVR